MPFIPLALCLFFQNIKLLLKPISFYICMFFQSPPTSSQTWSSLALTENDVTVTSVFYQNNSAPVYARSKVIHTSKWRLARALCYWEFLCDFSVFIMITMDGYKGRQIACLFMTWLSYASTYLLRKPLGVVSIRTLLSDVTWHALKCITWIL